MRRLMHGIHSTSRHHLLFLAILAPVPGQAAT